jgi:hypothetical protein
LAITVNINSHQACKATRLNTAAIGQAANALRKRAEVQTSHVYRGGLSAREA